ncbi:MAG: 4'-phosphopantetheinyl transferase superfamily protein [Firmicutes bacterium]|nr:4'-phosphopantetheinyl transferase superfamily protein [Bacillota bacterium]
MRATTTVWLLDLGVPGVDTRSFERLLDADELARARRFRSPADCRRFVIVRGTLRCLLGALLAVDPDRVPLTVEPGGRPTLASDCGLGGWSPRFSVSHSEGLAALAFSFSGRVGVDIERVRPLPDFDGLAAVAFAPSQRAALERIPAEGREHFFYLMWCRHEASGKALGVGLGLDPAYLAEAARRFTVLDFTPAPGYVGALAVEGPRTRSIPAFRRLEGLQGGPGLVSRWLAERGWGR